MAATRMEKKSGKCPGQPTIFALGEVRAAIPILVLRMILLAWVVAAIMFGMARLVGWDTYVLGVPSL